MSEDLTLDHLRKSASDIKARVDGRRRRFAESSPGILAVLRSRVFHLLLYYLRPRIVSVFFISALNLLSALMGGARVVVLIAVLGSLIGETIDLADNVGVLGLDVPLTFLESWFASDNGLLNGLLVLIAFTILSEICVFTAKYLARRIQAELNLEVREDLISQLFRLELSYFDDNKSGDIAYLQNALVGRFTSLLPSMQAMLSAVLDLAIGFALLIAISGWLAMLLGILGVLSTFVTRLFARRTGRMSFDAEEASRLASTHFLETLYGVRLVKQGGQEGRVKETYKTLARNRERAVFNLGNYKDFGGSIIRFGGLFVMMSGAYAASVLAGLNLLGNVSLGVGFLYLAMRISGSVNQIQGQWIRISSILPQFMMVAEFLLDKTYLERAVDDTLPAIDSINERISVNDLEFRYELDKGVLNGVSLDFPKGTITALVGLSGSGKTTLLELMAGIRNPESGQILIDDKNLGDFDISTYRPLVGYVNQETVIFHDTLLENLRYLRIDASMDEVQRAANLAIAEDFIAEAERGYDTVIGERGAKISGGQRQRIVIARVLLQDPRVLLLDEATSSLDLYTEALIYKNLLKLKKDKIIIVAAHRLSAITQFDNIVVFQDGLVAEQGTHADLMAARKLYYHLYKLQEYSPGAASLSLSDIDGQV